jgi:hypothetical protein
MIRSKSNTISSWRFRFAMMARCDLNSHDVTVDLNLFCTIDGRDVR